MKTVVAVLLMLASTVKQTARRSGAARYHWGPFHIDDAGHGDWKGTEQRTIQIRFSSVPESMVDALCGLRAIERKFGRIRDYRLLRDSEIRSEYQAVCWAAFESPESLLRVWPHGTTLKVTLPPRLGHPEGGPGLGDLKNLFVPEDDRSKPEPSTSQDESSRPARFVTLTVKRAGSAITYRNMAKPPFRSRAMKAAIGHGFLEWGGFAPLKPLYESSPFTAPAQDPPPLDSTNMRVALNKWSQILGVPDPLFPEMKEHLDGSEARQKDLGDGWEPLSDSLRMPRARADSADVKTRSSTQESLKQSLEGLLQRSRLGVTNEIDDSVVHKEKT